MPGIAKDAAPGGPETGRLPALVRAAIKDTIRSSSQSAGQIAGALSARLGARVTEHMLRDFTAESHPHRFPLEWLPAWLEVTGDWRLFYVLTDAIGLPRPSPRDADLLAYGKHALARDLTETEMEVLKARILQGGDSRGEARP